MSYRICHVSVYSSHAQLTCRHKRAQALPQPFPERSPVGAPLCPQVLAGAEYVGRWLLGCSFQEKLKRA